MAELSTTGPIGNDAGQGDLGPAAPATEDTTPIVDEGQPGGTETEGQTAEAVPGDDVSGDTFASTFDPKKITDPEALKAYKQMQADYTRKMSELAGMRQYQQVIDSFRRDPVGTLRQLNQQYGIGQPGPQQAQQVYFENFNPQSWGEVVQAIQQSIIPSVMQQIDARYQPVVGKVREMTQQTIESRLEKIDPNWRQYESSMQAVLQRHPSMANDLEGLYRLSVPAEISEAKATQAALAKIRGKAENSKVSGATNNKTVPEDGPPRGVPFSETWAWAKAQLAQQGITPP